jgi:hypothetical protein
MDVRLPDGTLIRDVPDGMTREQLTQKLAANGYDVSKLEPSGQRTEAYKAGTKAQPEARDSLAQLQGPTFGFLDELAGGVVGGAKTLFNDKPFKQNYEETRDYVRGASDEGMRVNPVRNSAGQMVFSAPLGALSMARAGMGKAAQYAAGIGTGAGFGLVSGAGNSEGRTAGDIGMDALKGAAFAGAVPAILQPAAAGTGAVIGNVASRFKDSAAMDIAKRKIAEAFVRDNPKATQATAQAARRMGTLGDEARVVDAGGSATRGLLDTMATLPGETKNAVEAAIRARQSTRADRMIGAAENAFGVGGVRLAPEMETWIAQRSAAAAPLYQKLHRMDVPITQDVAAIVDVAKRQGLDKLAKKIADYDQVPFTLPEQAANQAGTYSMRDLDYIKRAIDSVIPKLRDPQTQAATAEGRALMGLRDRLVSSLDDTTGGAYAQARNAWAGPSQVMDAASSGRQILNKDDATIKGLMAGMGASEKDAFALGAFEALRAKLGARAGQSQIMELWREKGLQEKLKAVFGDERSYREFASRVAAEGRMRGLEGVGRGSQTASRQYAAGDLDQAAGAAGQAIADAKTGNVLGLIARGAQSWNRVATPEPVRNAMGQILLQQGQPGRNALMDMATMSQQLARQRAMQAGGMGFSAPVIGNPLQQLLDRELQNNLR